MRVEFKRWGIILHFVFVLQVHGLHHHEWPGFQPRKISRETKQQSTVKQNECKLQPSFWCASNHMFWLMDLNVWDLELKGDMRLCNKYANPVKSSLERTKDSSTICENWTERISPLCTWATSFQAVQLACHVYKVRGQWNNTLLWFGGYHKRSNGFHVAFSASFLVSLQGRLEGSTGPNLAAAKSSYLEDHYANPHETTLQIHMKTIT